ncbi:hypothetical protein DPEC_G00185570 [Dallia pectoralis]|uniref:Uncharacterized protein n=1 Tax=Dallia pectoralis TaxID=75939 RepID=A0ACC2GBS7_DALPE|nr:hypothetical protein DPEC_G00185570 [Dallia pectoralis]
MSPACLLLKCWRYDRALAQPAGSYHPLGPDHSNIHQSVSRSSPSSLVQSGAHLPGTSDACAWLISEAPLGRTAGTLGGKEPRTAPPWQDDRLNDTRMAERATSLLIRLFMKRKGDRQISSHWVRFMSVELMPSLVLRI